MSKILAKFFPTFDLLYIYQLLEYNPANFLNWFVSHPFARNLQKKHKLVLTKKAILLLALTIVLQLLISSILSLKITNSLLLAPIVFILAQTITPFFILSANIIYYPLDWHFKSQLIHNAQDKLKRLKNLKIVAITGSYGKTSTKDILYTLLVKNFKVVKTPKSYNTPLGIAQTILDNLKGNTKIFIVEIGAYKRGEIAALAKFLKPDIAIITVVAPQHLQRFGSLENIAHTKFELVENLQPKKIAILNGEDEWLTKLATNLRLKKIFYGRGDYLIRATNIKQTIFGILFMLHTEKGSIKITIPLIGEHHVINFLAAAAATLQLGLNLKIIKDRAKLILPTPHRLEITKQGQITIIDNTYNSNPESAKASFKILNDYPGNRKIIITPGLVELGERQEEENIKFIYQASRIADEIFIVGQNARHLLQGLSDIHYPQNHIHMVKNAQEGLSLIAKRIKQETVVLLENDLPDQYF